MLPQALLPAFLTEAQKRGRVPNRGMMLYKLDSVIKINGPLGVFLLKGDKNVIHQDMGDGRLSLGKDAQIWYSWPLRLLPFFGCLSLYCLHATGEHVCSQGGGM